MKNASLPTSLLLIVASTSAADRFRLSWNGGEAADVRYIADRRTVRYKAPPASVSVAPRVYDTAFALRLEAMCGPGGAYHKGLNVLAALERGECKGAGTDALSTGGESKVPLHCDAGVAVPSKVARRIRKSTVLLAEVLCNGLERQHGFT